MMKTIQEIRNIIETTKTRSAWDRGVNTYLASPTILTSRAAFWWKVFTL